MKKILISFLITGVLTMTSAAASTGGTEPGSQLQKADSTAKNQTRISANINGSDRMLIAAATKTNQGKLEYSKKVSYDAKGKVNFSTETWLDKNTYDTREDFKTGDKEYSSTYIKNKAAKRIWIKRDSKGKPISGESSTISDQEMKFFKEQINSSTFEYVKKEYTKPEWKKVGNVKLNGKDVKKLSMTTGKSNSGKKSVAASISYAYLDTSTGLPVKLEVYTIENGKNKLSYYETREYKTVTADKNIFDTSGVKIKDIPVNKPIEGGVG